MNNYKIQLDGFEGPLELLIKLIDNNELDISQVSLSKITDQYIDYINDSENLEIGEVADFLVIAARLIYIKSKLILPEIMNINDEEDSKELEESLKMYKKYYEARQKLQEIIKKEKFTYSRTTKLVKIKTKFTPPKNVNSNIMEENFKKVLSRLKPINKIPKKLIKKTINIREKINHIRNLICRRKNLSFKEFINNKEDKTELIVSFLAMLELIKQRNIIVDQEFMFEEITIKSNL